MTNLKAGVRDIKPITEMLELDWDSAEELAKEVLNRAWDIYEQKSKFWVVGRLKYSTTEGYINEGDPRADYAAFGPYGTETQAKAAGTQLAYSNATGEEFIWRAFPVRHTTPAAWFKERKLARTEASKKQVPSYTPTTPESSAA